MMSPAEISGQLATEGQEMTESDFHTLMERFNNMQPWPTKKYLFATGSEKDLQL